MEHSYLTACHCGIQELVAIFFNCRKLETIISKLRFLCSVIKYIGNKRAHNFLIGAIPFCCNNILIFLLPSTNTTFISATQKYFKILATCLGRKKPSSGQNGTKSRHNEGALSMGSHTIHNCPYHTVRTFIAPRLCSILA
jgi:hypothetical protein